MPLAVPVARGSLEIRLVILGRDLTGGRRTHFLQILKATYVHLLGIGNNENNISEIFLPPGFGRPARSF